MKMESTIRLINLDQIIPNRFQPRLVFDNDSMQDLADSIRIHGIIEPLVLRRVGEKFEIIAGERRFKAASLAGLTAVPAIIVEVGDNESAEVAIIENTKRKNLTPIEEATSYKKLLERKYLTQDQLARRLGVSQSTIANKIRLLSLDPNVQTALLNEQISERHARTLLRVTDKMKQVELLNKIIAEKMSVRTLEALVEEIVQSYTKSTNVRILNPNSDVDINVDDVIKNSSDIVIDDNKPKYHYNPNIAASTEAKKESHFFNNLENENVNMDPTLTFGFNPFKTPSLDEAKITKEEDYDVLDDDPLREEEETVKKEIIEKLPEYETIDAVIEGIKYIIDNAKLNGISLTTEEFDFDKMHQYIIRVDK